jgi:MFS family permease
MYRLEWIEQLKLRTTARPASQRLSLVHPVVWRLGYTSLLTDISSEMVSSALPVFLVLTLHFTPLQYGAIDAAYNGVAIALLSLGAGMFADRSRRQKEVAAAGYGLSAVCKLLLLWAGSMWGWFLAITLLDRAGKGLRTAPRDALISLNTQPGMMATAFAVHRALDAGGALLGPVIAFTLLWLLPQRFDVVWVASFFFAVIGLAILWLFVSNPPPRADVVAEAPKMRSLSAALVSPRYRALVTCALLLSMTTVSDGFVYLTLQKKGANPVAFFPLFYVVTSAIYMMVSIPVGQWADRYGRATVLIAGYTILGIVYAIVATRTTLGLPAQALCLFLLGLYYAGTEGVFSAMVSNAVPAELRTTGLAGLATAVALGKMTSSIAFGWLWHARGLGPAFLVFGIAFAVAIVTAGVWLRESSPRPAHA